MSQPIPSPLCMLTTPGSASDERWRPSIQPQPYQAAVIRSESFWQRQNQQIAETSQAFSALGRALSRTLSDVLDFHIPDRSPPLGRKRRARRARGRQIQTNQRKRHA